MIHVNNVEKNNRAISFRLNYDENEMVLSAIGASGFTKSEFLRECILDYMDKIDIDSVNCIHAGRRGSKKDHSLQVLVSSPLYDSISIIGKKVSERITGRVGAVPVSTMAAILVLYAVEKENEERKLQEEN